MAATHDSASCAPGPESDPHVGAGAKAPIRHHLVLSASLPCAHRWQFPISAVLGTQAYCLHSANREEGGLFQPHWGR